MTPRPRNLYDRYHAHVYFGPDTVLRARTLCDQAGLLFGLRVGRVHERLVGPHPHWSCQLAFDSTQFESVIAWLEQHRDGLDVLVHGLTGDDLADHTQHASWLGNPSKLNLAMFGALDGRRSRRASGIGLPSPQVPLQEPRMTTSPSTPDSTPGVASLKSVHSFRDTLERLRDAFAAHGLKLFATVDHGAEATAVGLTMPPTVLLIFGNARAGTPLMLAHPLAALDLPLKALVSETVPGTVVVSFNTPQYLVERHGLPHEMAANLAPAGHLISQAVGR